MRDAQDLIRRMYTAFNARDIDAALAFMTDTVDWPKASEGGRITGKQEIRAYWTRQWAEFNPQVEPVEISPDGAAHITVKVHQVVRALTGDVLFDGSVVHVYTLKDGLIVRMDLKEDAPAFGQQPRG